MLTVKCYDMNCYAKSRLPSLEIKNCDLNKTASVQSLHFTNNVVWIRMLDGQEGRCTANRCTESVAPSKDLRYLLAWLRQERCNRSHNSATSTFLRCQVPLTLCLDMLLKWMSWLMPIKFCLYSVQPLDNWRRPQGGYLDLKCLQWHVLIWHGAARSQSSMCIHHYTCIVLCFIKIRQKGWFWAARSQGGSSRYVQNR